jgi:hypothetical protein
MKKQNHDAIPFADGVCKAPVLYQPSRPKSFVGISRM